MLPQAKWKFPSCNLRESLSISNGPGPLLMTSPHQGKASPLLTRGCGTALIIITASERLVNVHAPAWEVSPGRRRAEPALQKCVQQRRCSRHGAQLLQYPLKTLWPREMPAIQPRLLELLWLWLDPPHPRQKDPSPAPETLQISWRPWPPQLKKGCIPWAWRAFDLETLKYKFEQCWSSAELLFPTYTTLVWPMQFKTMV